MWLYRYNRVKISFIYLCVFCYVEFWKKNHEHFTFNWWNMCFMLQGRIQYFKLGGVLKIIAPSEARREKFWGISCEKSRLYAKKITFFPILEAPPWIRPCAIYLPCMNTLYMQSLCWCYYMHWLIYKTFILYTSWKWGVTFSNGFMAVLTWTALQVAIIKKSFIKHISLIRIEESWKL